MEIKIYALVDPRTNKIRYVGKTTQTLNKRLSQHICSNYKHNPHKFNWIKQLKENNLKPMIILLEICNENNWVEREKYYIQELDNLTNITQGGENGLFFTKEILEKISLGVKKAWENDEFKNKISNSRKLFWSDLENRKKVSDKLKGKKISDEHKLSLSNIKKEQWNNNNYKETMTIQSKNLWGNEEYKNKVLSYTKSDEHKENVSKRFKGKTLSDDHKQKMSDSSKNKKPISINNVIYESITQAAKLLNVNRDLIKGRLKSKTYPYYFYC